MLFRDCFRLLEDSSFDLDSSVMKQFHEMTINRVHGKLLLILRVMSLAWCGQVDGERKKKKKISFNFIVSYSIFLSKKTIEPVWINPIWTQLFSLVRDDLEHSDVGAKTNEDRRREGRAERVAPLAGVGAMGRSNEKNSNETHLRR